MDCLDEIEDPRAASNGTLYDFREMLVIAICVLMESVGLSMALGTFMAGVLLADSEYRHELISDLEPFKGLLLGLFFIAVGMSVDFGVLRAQPLLILALVAGLLVVKIALLYVLSKFVDIPRGQQLFFALALAVMVAIPSWFMVAEFFSTLALVEFSAVIELRNVVSAVRSDASALV